MPEKQISVQDQIDLEDLPLIAEQIVQEYRRRKENRKDREKLWDEVDRQLRMEPELSHKLGSDGKIDHEKKWLPETELPLQAQTLEMLTADARRLKFPKNQDWFSVRTALTDEYLQKYQKAGNPIPGESGEAPDLNQDNADRIAQAVVSHFHSQYDFRGNNDKIDAEAFSYGFGVGRLRKVRKTILSHTMKGNPIQQLIPVLVPRSARNVYLDDTMSAIMHEGEVIGPNIIQRRMVKYADLVAAAKNDASYIASQVKRLVPDKNKEVQLVELEGDLIYENASKTIVVRDVVLTAAGEEGNFGLVREQPGEGFSTYIVYDYHVESTLQRYGTSPLMKGMPIAKIAAQVMNRLIESGSLKNSPPLGYDRDSPTFAATGGPQVHPYAKWATTDEVNVYDEIGGDPSVFFNIFTGLVQLYSDVTGVNPPRLGAQTKSHTTAFAKDVEITQGSVRTVDYVNANLEGPMTRLLELEYRMGIKDWKKQLVFVEPWNEFIEVAKGHLPDTAIFKAIGSGAPAQDQQELQRKLAAVQIAGQFDQINVQFGQPPTLDYGALVIKTLQDAGFRDISEVTVEAEPVTQGNGQLPGLLSAESPLL